MSFARFSRVWPATWIVVLGMTLPAVAALPKVPEGFEVRLVATVPAVLYPCQVGTAPDGALFVAEDPMDQVGPYEARHGRLLIFREGKDPVVYADGFRAIQGMAWHKGALYVSHMPFLTVLRDTNGDDKADARHDLFHDLGPTDNRGLNDHIVSGIQFGMDGYLYISVGDKGIPHATGTDGRTIQIKGGGTCRCRPDGTGLEVISTGTRNHLEPNLDDRDNIFTYDNTDDGLGWWTRVTHHIDGGYYGYPYDYHPRPDRHLPRMAEYGGGSPCGAVLYKEDAWPEAYRGMGFWAEWGKGKVHAFRFKPEGSTFAVAQAVDFAVPNGVESFRPIDLAVSYDGRTLYVADWGMGGWGSKTEKVGRVFAITYKGEVKTRPRGKDSDPIAAQIKQLDHPSFNERMRAQEALIAHGSEALDAVAAALRDHATPALARRHLVWAFVGLEHNPRRAGKVLAEVVRDPEADVRGQAVRAVGLLGAGAVAGGVELAIARLGDPAATVRLQAAITLGRLDDARAVASLLPVLADGDRFIAFSARQALRRIDDWRAAAAGLNSDDPQVRAGVLAAMELVYRPDAAEALASFAADTKRPAGERARALQYLAQGHRKTRPWDGRWWGTRPYQGQPPAKEVDWERTPLILGAVRDRLGDPAPEVRLAAAEAVSEDRDRTALPALRARFAAEDDPRVQAAIARVFAALSDTEALPLLIATFRADRAPASVRDAALAAVESIGTKAATRGLTEALVQSPPDDERLPRLLAALGKLGDSQSVAPLVRTLANPAPKVRAAAAAALGRIGQTKESAPAVRALLGDAALEVRKAAIAALAALNDREAIPALVAAAEDRDTRFEATEALAAMPDVRALQVYLAGLADKSPDLRKRAAGAIANVRDQAIPVLEQLAARKELSPLAVPELRRVFVKMEPIAAWHTAGLFARKEAQPIAPEQEVRLSETYPGVDGQQVAWKEARSSDPSGRLDVSGLYPTGNDVVVYASAELKAPEARDAVMNVNTDDQLVVWLNGKEVHKTAGRRGPKREPEAVDIKLKAGTNRLLVRANNRSGRHGFALAVSEPGTYAFLKAPAAGSFNPESYRSVALKTKGSVEHGRTLFRDLKGLACIKCHAVQKEGGTVGPELSSVGAKYPRDELITSVLYPSARISSGYEPVVVATADGRVLTGVVKSDTPEALEIEDADARRVRIPRAEIDERKRSDVSLMPNGLAEGISASDFADLISYLETLKEVAAKPAAPAVGAGSGGEGR
jgi:putative membrane-bound dehydrogenase-like protein